MPALNLTRALSKNITRRVAITILSIFSIVNCVSIDAAPEHNKSSMPLLKEQSKEQSIEQLTLYKNQILGQLTDTLHHMASLLDKHEMMSQSQLQQVAMAINQLSINLHELTQKMGDAQLDKKSLVSLQKKNKHLRQEIENLLLQFNDN